MTSPATGPTSRELERVLRTRDRVRFRVYAAVRDAMLRSELFRSVPQLHEPEVVVNVTGAWVDVTAALNEGQFHLLLANERTPDLPRFAEELRRGIENAAREIGLDLSTDPARFGGSQPVMLGPLPIGYRAALLRRDESERPVP